MSASSNAASIDIRDANAWRLRPTLTWRAVLVVVLAVVILTYSGQRTEMHKLASLTLQALSSTVGFAPQSQVSDGFARVVGGMFPLQLSDVRETSRIANFDPAHLPLGAYLETRSNKQTTIDPQTLQQKTLTTSVEVLVEPYGYVMQVARLLLQTIEIAVWATVLALVIAFPCASLAATNYTPHSLIYAVVRAGSAFLRAVPELISALLLVLIFGFGPIAGVLALGLHTAGFLCKFFAEDIENADRAPQDALRALGANKLKVLRFAVLPLVGSSYLAYLQYILERNIRSATVIGIVGAGGIGQELKGRFEMFDFGHVGTILFAILLTVFMLELLTGRLRRRFI
ncbi:MAG TPA: phosphonate ABC transporter, permease protein PhnE [Steroidobacteraceae bacterium]|nr:phosphonate ABC transporter, permease protein PhnE [Steroidobacteraceae bacterium]